MRIVVDLNPVLHNRHSGFYAVGRGMLEGFSQLENEPEIAVFYSKRYRDSAEKLFSEIKYHPEAKEIFLKKRQLEKWWRTFGFPALQVFTGKFDVFHSLHHLMPATKGKPRVLTVHDLRRYRFPELYPASKLGAFELAIQKAEHFITVSEATKSDLCEFFGIDENKVDVVHLAADSNFKPTAEQQQKEIREKLSASLNTKLGRYLVAFSSGDKRKNVSGIIDGFFRSMPKIDEDIKLVIVGTPPKNDEAFDAIIANGLPDRVVIAGPIDDVTGIMQCAYGLVFTTLYEGFGVPIVEAFNCDVPVITSSVSSMPEIAGDAAITVNPNDTSEIADAIALLCGDFKKRKRLIELGRSRREAFSWKKHADELIKVYEKIDHR